MSLLPRKGILAIVAVVDVAVNSRHNPVSAKALSSRHRLPPRHLEPVLQALVRDGILKGIRGPRGGYQIAREQNQITAEEILRSATSAEDNENPQLPSSSLIKKVVEPTLIEAESHFSASLGRISVQEMVQVAEGLEEYRELLQETS